jgi:alkylation response protein AidB-like acyl-CoA dehydrogenase
MPGLGGDIPDYRASHAVRDVATRVLIPAAQDVDVSGVPSGHIQALKAERLLAVEAPAEFGGDAAPGTVSRDVTEVLSAACGSTWFIVAQHHTPLSHVLATDNSTARQRWLQPLASSQALGAVAYAYLRRPGPPAVVASRRGSGLRLRGRLDWVTGWTLADALLIAAVDGSDAVFALVAARPDEGMDVGPDLDLAAMGGSRTVPIVLDGLDLDEEHVVTRVPLEQWRADDRLRTVNASPAVFGLLGAIVDELDAVGRGRGEQELIDAATRLRASGAALRTDAYALIDGEPADEKMVERLKIRTASLDLALRASAALVAATSGSAMSRTHPAQRRAREALFHLVQAQTGEVRRRVVALLAGS